MSGENILKTLIELLEDQEKIKITYKTKTKGAVKSETIQNH